MNCGSLLKEAFSTSRRDRRAGSNGNAPRHQRAVVVGSPLFLSIVVAGFLAWRAERLVKPGPDIQYYDSVIRADTDWKLIVNDRNNPGTQFRVSIVHGKLRSPLKTRSG